jgi:hypothetical protein
MEETMTTRGILLAGCVIFLSLPVNAADKVSGVNKDLQVLSEVSSVIPDKPGHSFKQITETWKSTGSGDLANGWFTAVEQNDIIGGDITVRGYGTNHTASGDLAYFSWEGTGKVNPKDGGAFEMTGTGKFNWLGGTGKYQKINGQGTYTCKGNQAGVECPWQGEPQM